MTNIKSVLRDVLGSTLFVRPAPQPSFADVTDVLAAAECASVAVEPDYESFYEYSDLLAQVANELTDYGLDRAMPLLTNRRDTHVPAEMPNRPDVYAYAAEQWEQANDARYVRGHEAIDGYLLESVFGALSADSQEQAVDELVVLATIALQAAASIERHGL